MVCGRKCLIKAWERTKDRNKWSESKGKKKRKRLVYEVHGTFEFGTVNQRERVSREIKESISCVWHWVSTATAAARANVHDIASSANSKQGWRRKLYDKVSNSFWTPNSNLLRFSTRFIPIRGIWVENLIWLISVYLLNYTLSELNFHFSPRNYQMCLFLFQ